MNFGSPSLQSGVDKQLNAVYKYANVFTKNGITVDALVTISEKVDATLANVDQTANPTRFEPIITTSASGYFRFTFNFVDSATGLPVYLQDFFLTIVDLDGSSSTVKEFAEISGYANYAVNNPTGLTIDAGSNGRTRFRGINTSLSGVQFDDSASFIANYSAPVSSMDVVLGNTAALSDRQFSVNFGLPGGVFTTPVHTPNPSSPTISTTIHDGADNLLSPPAETITAVVISGETDAEVGQPVNVVVTDGANNRATVSTTVAAGGAYSVTADLSSLQDGPITAVASVVSMQGNPASAQDTTTMDAHRPPAYTGDGWNTAQTITEGEGLHALTATDPYNGTLTYTLQGGSLPPGIALNSNGSFSGTASYTASEGSPYTAHIRVTSPTGAFDDTTLEVTIDNWDTVPTLDPVPNLTSFENTAAFLQLVGADEDGDPLTYGATNLPTGLSIHSGTGVISGTHHNRSAGDYDVTVWVQDNTGDTRTSQTFTWTVENRAPQFDSNPDNTEQTIQETEKPSPLTATDSDDDTVELTYHISAGSLPGTLTLKSDGSFDGTTGYGDAGTYDLEVTVTDPQGATTTKALKLIVSNKDTAPTLGAVPDQYHSENQEVSLQLSGADADGDTLTYSATGLPDGLSISSSGLISGLLSYASAGNHPVTVTVADTAVDGVKEASRSFTWFVTNVNRAPEFTAFTPDNNVSQNIFENQGLAPVTATDADGQTVTYTLSGFLPGGIFFNNDGTFSGVASYRSAALSPYVVQVTATDGDLTDTSTLTIVVQEKDEAPVLQALPNQAHAEGVTVSMAVYGYGSDVDGDPVSYTFSGLPPGLTGYPNGEVTGTLPYDSFSPIPYTVVVILSDPTPSDSVTGTFLWWITDTNRPPVADGIPTAHTISEGQPLPTLVGFDPDGNQLTYTITEGSLPPGVALTVGGTFSGTVSYLATGPYTIKVRVDDGNGLSDTTEITYTIINVDTTPIIDPVGPQTDAENEQVTLDLVGGDADGDALVWSATGLPDGLSINPGNGQITGLLSYTSAGSHTVVVTLTDSTGGPAGTQTFSWTVTNVNRAPDFTGAATNIEQTIAEGAGLVPVVAVDLDGQSLTYTMAGGTLPEGISLNGNGSFSGTASYAAAGTYTVSIRATDPEGAYDATGLTIAVLNTDTVPTVDPVSTQNSTENQTISLQVTGRDTDGDTLTYSAAGLPPGLAIDPYTGRITGTLPYDAAGTYTVTVAVADDTGGHTGSGAFTWNVANLNRPPAFTDAPTNTAQSVNEAQGLTALEATDPDGQSLTYSLVTGTLPPGIGLSPNGSFSGTATYQATGTYQVTIRTADPDGGADTTTLTITVGNVNTHPALAPLSSRSNREGDSVSFPVTGTDVDGDTLTYSATGLPPGVSINPATGLISGSLGYMSSGTYTVTITVRDANGGAPATQTFTWVVSDVGLQGSLAVDVTDAETGAPLAASVTVSGPTPASGTGPAYRLSSASEGDYSVTVSASGYQSETLSAYVPPGGAANMTVALKPDEKKMVLASIRLTANPDSIIGDGKSTSLLTAVVSSTSGPVAGVQVNFTASAGTLAATSSTTGPNGEASVVYTAPSLTGIVAREETITATVRDVSRGLYGEETITIRIQPAAIEGIVTDSATGKPVNGARVEVAEDFDGDGKTDYRAAVVTGPDGHYRIVVPRGNWTYKPIVTYPTQVGNTTVTMKAPHPTQVGQVTGMGETYTATTKVGGQLMLAGNGSQQAGSIAPHLKQGATVTGEIRTADGKPVDAQITINPDGSYESDALPAGEYRLLFQVKAPDGTKLAGVMVTATVTEDGAIAMQPVLVDPFGIVTDADNGKPLSGVKMRVFWADTELNRSKGRVPGTEVQLPILPDFPPNQNASPQVTTAEGAYAWMVFPDGDYYLTAEKRGYLPFDSRKDPRSVPAKAGENSYIQNGNIHVGDTIVEYDLQLKKDTNTTHFRYIKGYPDGTFKPERSITRAEVATILARITGVTANGPLHQYPDVPATHWASTYIGLARQTGLMMGDPDGRFRPDEPISRAEVAVIAVRLKQLKPEAKGSPFADTHNHWADTWIAAAAADGIVTGFDGNVFRPRETTNRAQFVTMINRALGRGPLVGRTESNWPDVATAYWAWGHIEEASRSHTFEVDDAGVEHWRSDMEEPPLL